MEKPGSSIGPESGTELEDRDPNNLNHHLQVFLNIIFIIVSKNFNGYIFIVIDLINWYTL